MDYRMDYELTDSYEWDEAKRRENLEKHAIDFVAAFNFEWDDAVYNESPRYGETRWAATGYIGNRLYKVIYTMRDDRKRIISLRRANKREERDYAEAQTGTHQSDR